jgi:hypothetical protein
MAAVPDAGLIIIRSSLKKKEGEKLNPHNLQISFLFKIFYPKKGNEEAQKHEARQTMTWRDKLDLSQWEGECSSKIQDVNKTMVLPPMAPWSTP